MDSAAARSGGAVLEIVIDEHKIDRASAERFRCAVEAAGVGTETGQTAVVRLLIDCGGGKYNGTFDIIEQVRALQASGVVVEAFISGQCGSLAAVLAAACDRVEISSTGSLMWHGLVLTSFAGDRNALAVRLERLDAQIDRVVEVLLARARRYPDRRDARLARRSSLRKLMRTAEHIWFSPTEALTAGLVEAISEPSELLAAA